MLTATTISSLLTDAIDNRQIVTFRYNGHYRGVEPFTLGRMHNGTLQLSGFQITGSSESGGIPDWRLFDTRKITNLEIHEENFAGNRRGYNPRDSRMSRIIATV